MTRLAGLAAALTFEHGLAAVLFLAFSASLPALLGPAAYVSFNLASRQGGLFLFLPFAGFVLLIAALLALLVIVSTSLLVTRRLLGRDVGAGSFPRALWAQLGRLRGAVKTVLDRPGDVFFNPFTLPAWLEEGGSLFQAATRAAVFAAERREAFRAARPLHRGAMSVVFGTLTLFLPLSIGFFCFPALSASPAAWLGLALALCVVLWLLTVAFACAQAHACAVYLHALGPDAVRARVLERVPVQFLTTGEAPPPPPAPAPKREEYSEERILPPAKKVEPLPFAEEHDHEFPTVAPAPVPAPPPAVVFEPYEPARRESVAAPALAFYRVALLAALGGLVLYTFQALDGPLLLARWHAMYSGRPAWVEVESIEASTRAGEYVNEALVKPGGLVLLGEGASGMVKRGDKLPAHLDADGRAHLDEDWGFARRRAALLLSLCGVLLVGGWSFLFRVL